VGVSDHPDPAYRRARVSSRREAWPLCESIHFINLSLLLGTVGFFDLRLLGFARRIPIAALHHLSPLGVATSYRPMADY
jgi:hypothetical protein